MDSNNFAFRMEKFIPFCVTKMCAVQENNFQQTVPMEQEANILPFSLFDEIDSKSAISLLISCALFIFVIVEWIST